MDALAKVGWNGTAWLCPECWQPMERPAAWQATDQPWRCPTHRAFWSGAELHQQWHLQLRNQRLLYLDACRVTRDAWIAQLEKALRSVSRLTWRGQTEAVHDLIADTFYPHRNRKVPPLRLDGAGRVIPTDAQVEQAYLLYSHLADTAFSAASPRLPTLAYRALWRWLGLFAAAGLDVRTGHRLPRFPT